MHGEHGFEDAILTEEAFGKPRTEWDADYAQYARKKAQACLVAEGARDAMIGDAHWMLPPMERISAVKFGKLVAIMSALSTVTAF